MAKVKFTPYEAIFNNALSGMSIYHQSSPNQAWVIDYVKVEKQTRTLEVHCTNGEVFIANQDDILEWEVNNENPHGVPTKPKLRV